MKIVTAIFITILAVTQMAAGAIAKEFRYAYRIDAASLDPYALAETFTLAFLGLTYEPLVGRGKNLELVPALAEEWELVGDRTWRFKLRPDVTFHDGSPFTADDVVFSFERGAMKGSDVSYMIAAAEEVKKVDDLTIEIVTKKPNPIFPQQITSFYIMSKGWAEENDATSPSSVKAEVKNRATTDANGTGPFMIKERQQDVRTVFVPNPDWWGPSEHNLTEAIFTPIKSDATRVAALLSGEVDMIYPVPIQDVDRVNSTGKHEVLQGPELRTIFVNMDQSRDELLESSVKGKNPFKDRRVRLAFLHAIDVNAIQDKVMRGASRPSALMVGPGVSGYDAQLDQRVAYDPERAKELLAEAGYPDGFQLGMDCPNDRYVNDEKICLAIVSMLAKVGVKVDLLAQTRSKYFEKILGLNTSFSILGWQPLTYDSHDTFHSVVSTRGEQVGTYNIGNYSNHYVDLLTQMAETESDTDRRQALLSGAFAIHKHEVGHIPLHQQTLAWGVRKGIDLVQRADDSFDLRWVVIK